MPSALLFAMRGIGIEQNFISVQAIILIHQVILSSSNFPNAKHLSLFKSRKLITVVGNDNLLNFTPKKQHWQLLKNIRQDLRVDCLLMET